MGLQLERITKHTAFYGIQPDLFQAATKSTKFIEEKEQLSILEDEIV